MKKFRKWILYGTALTLTVAATSLVQTRLIARDEPYDQLKTLAECLTLIQADYALGYREDRPIRCEPWPAQGWQRPA